MSGLATQTIGSPILCGRERKGMAEVARNLAGLEGQDETLLYDAGVVYRRSSACGVFELSRKASSKRINTASYLSGATQTYSATAAMVGRKASTRRYR